MNIPLSNDYFYHDRLVAKIQHFADALDRMKTEKESLGMVVKEKSIIHELKQEINTYEEIIELYANQFREILYT